jgi:hypothetical protein
MPSFAQPVQLTQAERQRLDSLLFAGDFDQLRSALEKKDEQIMSLNLDEETVATYRQRVQGYTRVLDTIASIKEQEPDYIAYYVTQRLGQEELHQSSEVGHHAAELYDAFVRLVQEGEHAEAAGYYVAASFAKGGHLRMIEQRLASHYNRAQLAYEAEAYEQARSTIDSVRTYFGSINALHLPWIDRLERLYSNAERLQAEEEKEERNWGRSERPSFKGGLSLSGQLITRSAVGPVTIQLHDPASADNVGAIDREFKWSFQHSYGLEAYAFLGSQWAIGGGVTYTSYSFASENNETFSFNFETKSETAYAFARYTLRPEVGLRPYLLAGGGVIQTGKGKGEAAVYGTTSGQVRTYYEYELDVDVEESTGTQARMGLGIEYVSCANCKFVVGGEIGGVRNFLDSTVISDWQSLLSFRIGFYL